MPDVYASTSQQTIQIPISEQKYRLYLLQNNSCFYQ